MYPHHSCMQRGGANLRRGREIRNVDQSLAAVSIALFRLVVAQPDAGELTGAPVCPLQGQRVGIRMDTLESGWNFQGKCRPARAARALK